MHWAQCEKINFYIRSLSAVLIGLFHFRGVGEATFKFSTPSPIELNFCSAEFLTVATSHRTDFFKEFMWERFWGTLLI